MNKKIKTEAVDHLFQAILALKSPEDATAFLRMCVQSMKFFPFHSAMR